MNKKVAQPAVYIASKIYLLNALGRSQVFVSVGQGVLVQRNVVKRHFIRFRKTKNPFRSGETEGQPSCSTWENID